MSDLTPITREEALLDGADLEPITRKEQFIKRIYDKTQEVPTPITREEWFLNKAGEGGSEVTVEQLNATENGTYSEQGKAYSPVIVEVPEPTLISKSITANGTYTASDDNADGYSQVTVAVDGFKKKSIANTPTDIASFNDGTANPMPSLEISIEPVQSGSGDPSPSNVRPISGWSGAKIADDAEYGGFINWNQLVQNGNFVDTSGWGRDDATIAVENNICTVTVKGILTGGQGIYQQNKSVTKDHKYLMCADFKYDHENVTVSLRLGGVSGNAPRIVPTANAWYQVTRVANVTETASVSFELDVDVRTGFAVDDTYQVRNVNLIDLTQLFGSTIADYIYSLEQATAGAGVAYFRNLFPHDYYPYNAGEITTVSAVNGDVDKYSITSIPFHDNSDNPITVYGGALNVTSGELRATYANIASYNGETINEPWISSMDVYSAGATPTTGAQVVYPLATPQTYQLTPTQVSTLLGQNNIFADCGQVLEGEYFVTL